jgi:hypothetical protein
MPMLSSLCTDWSGDGLQDNSPHIGAEPKYAEGCSADFVEFHRHVWIVERIALSRESRVHHAGVGVGPDPISEHGS